MARSGYLEYLIQRSVHFVFVGIGEHGKRKVVKNVRVFEIVKEIKLRHSPGVVRVEE